MFSEFAFACKCLCENRLLAASWDCRIWHSTELDNIAGRDDTRHIAKVGMMEGERLWCLGFCRHLCRLFQYSLRYHQNLKVVMRYEKQALNRSYAIQWFTIDERFCNHREVEIRPGGPVRRAGTARLRKCLLCLSPSCFPKRKIV